jgi:hypothetical protein
LIISPILWRRSLTQLKFHHWSLIGYHVLLISIDEFIHLSLRCTELRKFVVSFLQYENDYNYMFLIHFKFGKYTFFYFWQCYTMKLTETAKCKSQLTEAEFWLYGNSNSHVSLYWHTINEKIGESRLLFFLEYLSRCLEIDSVSLIASWGDGETIHNWRCSRPIVLLYHLLRDPAKSISACNIYFR